MSEYKGCEFPEDLLYDLDYVWARLEDNGLVTLGVTDAAQTMAGRIQTLRIKKLGTHLIRGRHVATLESGKWAGGVPCPFDGIVDSINQNVLDRPQLINIAPYADGWLARVRPFDVSGALDTLTTGPKAMAALRAWVDRYDVQCMRCSTPT